MALIKCPECRKTVSEAAIACPGCGFALTLDLVVAQKVKKQKNEQAAVLIGVGIFLVIVVPCSRVLTSSWLPPSTSPSSYSPSAAKPVATSSYLTDAVRQRELGQKYHPTPSEIREYLILDGRQASARGIDVQSCLREIHRGEVPRMTENQKFAGTALAMIGGTVLLISLARLLGNAGTAEPTGTIAKPAVMPQRVETAQPVAGTSAPLDGTLLPGSPRLHRLRDRNRTQYRAGPQLHPFDAR